MEGFVYQVHEERRTSGLDEWSSEELEDLTMLLHFGRHMKETRPQYVGNVVCCTPATDFVRYITDDVYLRLTNRDTPYTSQFTKRVRKMIAYICERVMQPPLDKTDYNSASFSDLFDRILKKQIEWHI